MCLWRVRRDTSGPETTGGFLSMQLCYDAEITRSGSAPAPVVHAQWQVNHEKLHGELLPVTEAAAILTPWRALCADLAEENPFFEPWALGPALQAFAGDDAKLACIWRGAGRSELIGLLPVRAAHGYARLPVRYWTTWLHPYCFFGAPLIRRRFERAALKALFALLCDGAGREMMVRCDRVDADGPIALALRAAAVEDGRHHYQAGTSSRAMLRAPLNPGAEPKLPLRKKKRKELKRLRNRLEEHGRISFRTLCACEQCEDWVEEFLTLEHKGWKKRKGTSFKSIAQHADFFRAAVKEGFNQGKVQIMRLDLDGRAIAMLVNFGAGAGYSFKICYDPASARFSPGVMLKIEHTKRLLADPAFSYMDSCAAADHSMINSLWKERRTITGVNVSGRAAGKIALLRFCQALETSSALMRRAAGRIGVGSDAS